MEHASLDTLRPLDLVGPSAASYARAFARFEARDGRWAPSWNFAAFFASTAWFAYRRMWFWVAANTLFVGLGFAAMIAQTQRDLGLGPDSTYWDNPWNFVTRLWMATAYLGLPLCANWLYFRSLESRLARARSHPGGPARNPAAPVVCGFVLLSMPLVASFGSKALPDGDAPGRVNIATLMASGLRAEIEKFHESRGRLPVANESSAFASTFDNKAARSIHYDARNRILVVTLSAPFDGRRFGYQAAVRDGKLEWTCHTIDLNRRYLPATCRD